MQFPTDVLEMSGGAHILAYSTAVMSWDLCGGYLYYIDL